MMVFDVGSDDSAGPGQEASQSTLSVIVVNYRRPDLLADALQALRLSQRRPDEVIIVEVEAITAPVILADEQGPVMPTRVLMLQDNPGYAAACNRGAKDARGDWLLFMNADVTPAVDCLGTVLEEAMSDPGIGIATCRLMKPDGSLDHACHRGIPSVFDSLAYKARLDRLWPGSKRLVHYRLSWLDPSAVHDIEACTGAFLLIRRDVFDAVGGWDERYWFYAEDLDLCLRVSQAGGRVRFVGTTTATHLKGASSHLRQDPRSLDDEQRATRQRVERAVVEAHDLFYREHLEARTPRILRPFIAAQFGLQRRLQRRAR
jgi:GT2 family glycosyltransferase